jgi:hypothetical protein
MFPLTSMPLFGDWVTVCRTPWSVCRQKTRCRTLTRAQVGSREIDHATQTTSRQRGTPDTLYTQRGVATGVRSGSRMPRSVLVSASRKTVSTRKLRKLPKSLAIGLPDIPILYTIGS